MEIKGGSFVDYVTIRDAMQTLYSFARQPKVVRVLGNKTRWFESGTGRLYTVVSLPPLRVYDLIKIVTNDKTNTKVLVETEIKKSFQGIDEETYPVDYDGEKILDIGTGIHTLYGTLPFRIEIDTSIVTTPEELELMKYISIYVVSLPFDINKYDPLTPLSSPDDLMYDDDFVLPEKGDEIDVLNIRNLKAYYYTDYRYSSVNLSPKMISIGIPVPYPLYAQRFFYNKNIDEIRGLIDTFFLATVIGNEDNDCYISTEKYILGDNIIIDDFNTTTGYERNEIFSPLTTDLRPRIVTREISRVDSCVFFDLKPLIMTTDSFSFSEIIRCANIIKKLKEFGFIDNRNALEDIINPSCYLQGFTQISTEQKGVNMYDSKYIKTATREITDPDIGLVTIYVSKNTY